MQDGTKRLENLRCQIGELESQNAIVCQKKDLIEANVSELVKIDIKNSIYAESRKINQIQRLFTSNILRDWIDLP